MIIINEHILFLPQQLVDMAVFSASSFHPIDGDHQLKCDVVQHCTALHASNKAASTAAAALSVHQFVRHSVVR